jgi:predicted Rdx family selenoprotein
MVCTVNLTSHPIFPFNNTSRTLNEKFSDRFCIYDFLRQYIVIMELRGRVTMIRGGGEKKFRFSIDDDVVLLHRPTRGIASLSSTIYTTYTSSRYIVPFEFANTMVFHGKSPLHWGISAALTVAVEAAVMAYVAMKGREDLDLSATNITLVAILCLSAAMTLVLSNTIIVHVLFCQTAQWMLKSDRFSEEVQRLEVIATNSFTTKTCCSTSFRHRVQAEYEVGCYSVSKTWERKEEEGLFTEARSGALRARALKMFPSVATPLLGAEASILDEEGIPLAKALRIPCMMLILGTVGLVALSRFEILLGISFLQASDDYSPSYVAPVGVGYAVLLFLEIIASFPRFFLYDGVVTYIGEDRRRMRQKDTSQATTTHLDGMRGQLSSQQSFRSSQRSLFASTHSAAENDMKEDEEEKVHDDPV